MLYLVIIKLWIVILLKWFKLKLGKEKFEGLVVLFRIFICW